MTNNNSDDEKKNRFESNKKYFTICVYAVLTFLVCVILMRLITNWSDAKEKAANILTVLSPFLIAFLLAYFIIPLVETIDKFLINKIFKGKPPKKHKIIAVIISYIVVIGFIVLVLIFVVPQMMSSIAELVMQSPTIYNSVYDSISRLNERFPNIDLSFLETATRTALPDFVTYVRTFLSDIVLPFLYSAGLSIISWIVNILLAFVISCYIIFDKHSLKQSAKRFMYAFFAENTAQKIIEVSRECNRIFSKYMIGKAIDSLIIGCLCFILMTIARLPYALLISLFVGITNMIPYFGPFIGAVPGVIILLISSPQQALIFAILILILQQLDGAVIGPKILGSSTGLQPMAIIFAIIVGGSFAGVLGMFLGVPVIAVLSYLMTELINFMLKKKGKTPALQELGTKSSTPVAEDFKKEFSELPYDEDHNISDKVSKKSKH